MTTSFGCMDDAAIAALLAAAAAAAAVLGVAAAADAAAAAVAFEFCNIFWGVLFCFFLLLFPFSCFLFLYFVVVAALFKAAFAAEDACRRSWWCRRWWCW